VVVFRLTQDEFRNLKLACDLRGARNISEFTRSEILAALRSTADGETMSPLERVQREIRQLRSSIIEALRALQEKKP
jgi:hypothetical protein